MAEAAVIIRNSPRVEALVRDFEEKHKAFVATEPKHRDVIGYHRMRAMFRKDILAAVAEQNKPPKKIEKVDTIKVDVSKSKS